jgi:hypothetical protein
LELLDHLFTSKISFHHKSISEKYAKAHKNSNYLLDFFRDRIAEYKQSGKGDSDSEPTDYLSAFLQVGQSYIDGNF